MRIGEDRQTWGQASTPPVLPIGTDLAGGSSCRPLPYTRCRCRWARKHADTQRRLCGRYLAPVIGHLACEDIKTGHLQEAVNAAPTVGEGDRVRRCISALVSAGITGGYLTSPRLKLVHWQPGEDRPAPSRW